MTDAPALEKNEPPELTSPRAVLANRYINFRSEVLGIQMQALSGIDSPNSNIQDALLIAESELKQLKNDKQLVNKGDFDVADIYRDRELARQKELAKLRKQ